MTETLAPHLPLLGPYLQIKGLTLLPSYTNAEAAEVFACSRRTILNYINRGLLRPRRLPGRKNFLPIDLEELLQVRQGG